MWRAHVIRNDYTRKPNNSHSIYHLLYIGHGLEFYTDILNPDDREKKKREGICKWQLPRTGAGKSLRHVPNIWNSLFNRNVITNISPSSLGVFNAIYNLLLLLSLSLQKCSILNWPWKLEFSQLMFSDPVPLISQVNEDIFVIVRP